MLGEVQASQLSAKLGYKTTGFSFVGCIFRVSGFEHRFFEGRLVFQQLKKESGKPDAGFLSTILSKFGGGTNLTREEHAELVDYLGSLNSGSGCDSSQIRAVKNYLSKIIGL